MSPTPHVNVRDDMLASPAIRQPIPVLPRATFEAALSLLAAGRLPTIEAVAAQAKIALAGSSPPLTSIGIDQVARCTPEWVRLGYDGVPAETMRLLCRNGRLRHIVLERNDAVPYGFDDASKPLSGTEQVAAYPLDDEMSRFARRLGLTVTDVSNSASHRAEHSGHMQADTPALLVTSDGGGAVIRADAFANGFIAGMAILTPAEASP